MPVTDAPSVGPRLGEASVEFQILRQIEFLTQSSVRSRLDVVILAGFALAIVVLYQVTYLSWHAVPGNNLEYPLGWWGWFDQGQYLRGARALLEGNFTPSEHYYPPLYPLIGAAFVELFPQHVYYFVDLVATVGFFLLFVATTRRYIGFWPATIVGFAFVAPANMIRLLWVIPWTSTVSAVLVGAAFLLFDRYDRARRDGRWKLRGHIASGLMFGLVCGLQLPLRPGDIVLMAPVAIAYAILVGIDLVRGGEAGARRNAVGAAVAGLLGLVPGAVIMFGFNLLAFGDLLGGYFALSVSRGFYFIDFGEKLFSLVVASHPFYLEQGADWLSRLPVNALCLGFLPAAVLFARPLLFRLVALAAILQIVLYFSYGDAIPPGTFRYWNIHYFKWMLPWIVAFAVYFLYQAFVARSADRRLALAGLGTGVAASLLLFSVNVDLVPRPVSSLEASDGPAVVLRFPDGPAIDYIDFDGMPGGWSEVYFDNLATIRADGGSPLENYSEYRMLPRNGDGIRLLFIRPLDVETLSVDFGAALERSAPISEADVHPVTAKFVLDWPFASHWR